MILRRTCKFLICMIFKLSDELLLSDLIAISLGKSFNECATDFLYHYYCLRFQIHHWKISRNLVFGRLWENDYHKKFPPILLRDGPLVGNHWSGRGTNKFGDSNTYNLTNHLGFWNPYSERTYKIQVYATHFIFEDWQNWERRHTKYLSLFLTRYYLPPSAGRKAA